MKGYTLIEMLIVVVIIMATGVVVMVIAGGANIDRCWFAKDPFYCMEQRDALRSMAK